MPKSVFSQQKKNLSSLFFFLFLLSQSKSLNYKTTFTLQLYCSTMCWRGLVLLKYSHSLKKKKKLYLYCSTKCCTWSTYYWSNILIHKIRANYQRLAGKRGESTWVWSCFTRLSCSFSHVKRVSNSVAHFFARQSKLGNELQEWLDSLPDDLAPLALRDFL